MIESLFKKHFAWYKSHCHKLVNGDCAGFNCRCQKWAEIWAIIEEFVPEQYRTLNIDDFTGLVDNNRQLQLNIVLQAKNIIKQYCWANIQEGEDWDKSWISKSILNNRKENCNNLIIHGSSWAKTGDNSKLIHRKLGRTMLASIVMKEAIFQRIFPNSASDSYGWISYNILLDKLMSRANDKIEFIDDLSKLEECDWLVIDEIKTGKDHNRVFRASVFDRFLNKRLELRKPTIMVFNEDIEKSSNFTEEFGNVAEKIVQSNSTFKVHLI